MGVSLTWRLVQHPQVAMKGEAFLITVSND